MDNIVKDSLIKDITSKIEEVKSANEENIKNHNTENDLKIKQLSESLIAESKRLDELESNSKRANFNGSNEDNSQELKSFSNLLKKQVSCDEYTHYTKAYDKFLRSAGNMALLDPQDQKALQVGNDAQGGFFVRPELSNTIIQKSFETSPIRSLASVNSISTDAWESIVDFDEFDAEYVAELATKNTTNNTTFSKIRIDAEEIYAKPLVSNKMLEDSAIDIESYIVNKIADKFARKEATSYISGTGVGEAKGLQSYPNGTTYGTVEQVETNTSLLIKPDDILGTAGTLKAKYHGNAVWLMSRVTFFSKILTFKTGTGEYILEAFKDPKGGRIVYSILGYPVVFADDMLQAGVNTNFTAGQLPIMFGDIRESYQIVDRLGISMLRDPYTQDGAVKFSSRKRSGGGVKNTEAYKILKIKA